MRSRASSANAFGACLLRDGMEVNRKPTGPLVKMEICAIPLAVAGSNPAVDRLPTRREQTSPKLTSNRRAQPEMAEGIFFTPIARNSLKSPILEK